MSTTVEVLRKARGLYAANPSHAPAIKIPTGRDVCAVMAVYVAATKASYESAYNALLLAAGVDEGCLVDWNAEHTTGEVLAAFDRAIELAEVKS